MLKLKKLLLEAPIGTFYIKVAIRDSRKALEILDSDFRNEDIDISGDTYYFTDQAVAYDVMMEFHANDIEITGKSEDIEESVIDEATKIGKMSRYDIEDKIMKIAKVMKGVKKPYDEIEQSLSDYLKKLFKQLNKLEESVINEDKKITEAAEKIFDALVNARVTKKPYKRIAMKVIEFQLRAIRFGGL